MRVDLKDAEDVEDVGGNTSDNYIRVEMLFNSLMTEAFEISYTDELIQRMFAHVKTQVENPRIPENDYTLNKIIHTHIKFLG